MKTQRDDLQREIRSLNDTIAFCIVKQLPEDAPIYKYLINRRDDLVSTLINIQ